MIQRVILICRDIADADSAILIVSAVSKKKKAAENSVASFCY